MSLELNLAIQKAEDCTGFRIQETTGAYNQYTNLTGYGFPNASSCTITSLSITDTNGLTHTVTRYDGDNINSTNGIIADIVNTDLGLDADALIPDGVYTINYTITDNGNPPAQANRDYTIEKDVLVTCQVECCLDKKLLAIRVPDCDCEVEDINNLDIAYMMLEAAQLAIDCGKTALAESNLAFVQKFCNYEECKTCH